MRSTLLIGLALALGALLGGQLLEGGHVSSLWQPAALLIVLGGTAGAVALQFPGATISRAVAELRRSVGPPPDLDGAINTVTSLARRVRRDGLVSIDRETTSIKDPFLRRALELAADGVAVVELRRLLELLLDRAEEEHESAPRVLEAAGGYAPTLGILGAVMGLIHVMENLSDPSKLGSGIAVAFVATVYGVAAANLLFLPLGGRLRTRARATLLRLEAIVEGVCGLAAGENPRMLEQRLAGYTQKERLKAAAPPALRGAA